jgi:hypothetical protein
MYVYIASLVRTEWTARIIKVGKGEQARNQSCAHSFMPPKADRRIRRQTRKAEGLPSGADGSILALTQLVRGST